MRLELRNVPVNRAEFGNATGVSGGIIKIARDELHSVIAADRRLDAVEVEIANPGDDCRIVGIFDVFEPRFKPDGPNFPGLIEPIRRVGDGVTTVVRGAAVMLLNAMADRYGSSVDMRGPGAQFTPYSKTANVCIRSRPAPGVDRPNYYRALKEAGARTSKYLAEAASKAESARTEIFDLDLAARDNGKLPRVAYIYMVASQQRPTEADEPVIYGDNVRHLLPTVLHPNEILDGAVISPYWNFGGDSYTVINHPIVLELYRRHAKDLCFAGVISMIAAETEAARTRSAVIAAGLARNALGADAVIITKYGGGIPESAAMETYDECGRLGIKGVIVIWVHGGDGSIDGSLTFMSPRADAVVSCGIGEETIELPPVARVIGINRDGPNVIESEGHPYPADGAIKVRFLEIAGAADQLGGTRRSSEEY